MISPIVVFLALLLSTEVAPNTIQIDCDAVTTDLRNSTSDDLCVIVLNQQKWNISSLAQSSVMLPKFDKFNLVGVNGSFPSVHFFSTKTRLEKLLIYDSVMHEVQFPTILESLLITRSHTRQLIIENTDKHQYALHTLVLVDNELSKLPRIDQLIHLKSFSIANNLLEKVNLTEFGKLYELESLDVSSNRIREIVIGTINLLSLHKLDLSQNMLKSLPQNLGQLGSLETLVLHHNKLEYIEMSHLNGLTKLKILDLRFNNLLIGSLVPVLLPALEIVRLESCRLQQLDLHSIETPKLKKLHIEDNKLEYVEAFFEGVYQGAGLELYGDRNPWNCNWLQDKHPRVKFVVQQDRQTCRRFVKNVCCAGSDYATERKADRRLQVVQEQNRMIYKVLEEQQDKLRIKGGNCEMMGNRLSKIESTLGEIMSLVKMMAIKIDSIK
ncbi:leucine-rich repeat-containing protein 40-like [Aedes aegypti]|uniref:Uncharacterized protein n=1 Tax=Aedes aegypti TaxID=7159 RepID=A0A6I8U6K3_AEDAE|nr:leucine-rich repeat-containing protein 40-like [Aedes aegypti]